MCFVFYSHLKNVKEVYVTTTLDRQAQAVRGQVGQRGRALGLPVRGPGHRPCLAPPRCPSTGEPCLRRCPRRPRQPG